jgi:hypothetical protein
LAGKVGCGRLGFATGGPDESREKTAMLVKIGESVTLPGNIVITPVWRGSGIRLDVKGPVGTTVNGKPIPASHVIAKPAVEARREE